MVDKNAILRNNLQLARLPGKNRALKIQTTIRRANIPCSTERSTSCYFQNILAALLVNSSNVRHLVSGWWLVCFNIIVPRIIFAVLLLLGAAAPRRSTAPHRTFLPILHYSAFPKRSLPRSCSFLAGLRTNKFHRAYPQYHPLCRPAMLPFDAPWQKPPKWIFVTFCRVTVQRFGISSLRYLEVFGNT